MSSATMLPKKQSSYRLSGAALAGIRELSDRYGLSQAGTLELLLRKLSQDHPHKVLTDTALRNRMDANRSASAPMEPHPFRLSETAKGIISSLAADHDLSKAEVLEMVVLHMLEGYGNIL